MNNHPPSTPGTRRKQAPGLLQGGQTDGRFIRESQIHDHSSYIHVCSQQQDGFQHLQAHVSTAAFDPKDKVDAPKCHPNTRVAVLDAIMSWILLALTSVELIMWLNGAAGAGKSAIARSVVARCLQLNIPIARFFFFRTDSTRNSTDSVVATLAHQLIKCLPDLKMPIVTRIQEEPLIFNQSLETQFQYLIFEPLVLLKEHSTTNQTVLILFDGLDELSGNDNQTELIRIMATFVASKSFPLIAFFGSRSEYQIKQTFSSRVVHNILRPLPLDNNYMAEDDIRLFLNDRFSEIKESHPHNCLLDPTWPPLAHIQEIIDKSSGQFIYASAVVKFISIPTAHPAQQLDIVRGLRPVGVHTPFAQLDALYRHILSQVDYMRSVMHILAAVIFSGLDRIFGLETIFPGHIYASTTPILLSSLASVIDIRHDSIHFLHASLADFLLDRTRSMEFFLDRASWTTQLLFEFTDDSAIIRTYIDAYTALLHHAEPTHSLRHQLTNVYPSSTITTSWTSYLSAVKKLDFGDGGEVYRVQFKHILRDIAINAPYSLPLLQEHHDISHVMEEFKREEPELARQLAAHITTTPIAVTSQGQKLVKRSLRTRITKKSKTWITRLWS